MKKKRGKKEYLWREYELKNEKKKKKTKACGGSGDKRN